MSDAPPEYISSDDDELGDDALVAQASSSSSSSSPSSEDSSASSAEPAPRRRGPRSSASGVAAMFWRKVSAEGSAADEMMAREDNDGTEMSVSDDEEPAAKISRNRSRKEAMACLVMATFYGASAILQFVLGAGEGADPCDVLYRITVAHIPAVLALIISFLYLWIYRRWSVLLEDTPEDSPLYLGMIVILVRTSQAKQVHMLSVAAGSVWAIFIVPESNEECVSAVCLIIDHDIFLPLVLVLFLFSPPLSICFVLTHAKIYRIPGQIRLVRQR
jgi:hypothetical protein